MAKKHTTYKADTAIYLIYALLGNVMLALLSPIVSIAQQHPPIPIKVYAYPQELNFGTFYQGSVGGSVIIYPNGVRAVTGDVVDVNIGFPISPAIFEIEAATGTMISILNGPDVLLTGSNGGSMTLHLGSSSPASPFISTMSPPLRTTVNIGATLQVGVPLANPPGSYSGSFSIIFMQE